MKKNFIKNLIFIFIFSCNSFDNEVTYFGGKIINKTSDKISLLKDENILNESLISNDDVFFMSIDSIADGLYNFKHLPEFQYLIFETADSLVMRLNAIDFDESLVFTGKGASKNNYLIDVFLKHEDEESFLNSKLRDNPDIFKMIIDSLLTIKKLKFKNFQKLKKSNKTSNLIIDHAIKLPLYSKLETYISGLKQNNKLDLISKEYYNFREDISLNISELSNFKPYLDYIIFRINNIPKTNFNSYSNLDLQFNLDKIRFVDTKITDSNIRSKVLRYIAFEYLLKENILIDIDTFLNTFLKISVDQKTNLEIQQLYVNIISLQKGKYLPNIELTDINNDIRIANNFQFDRPIIYTFWSYEQNSHQISLFNRIFEFLNTNTKYQFHCININSNKMKWKESLEKIRRSKHITHFISNDFNKMSKKMVLNNLNKIIITDKEGKVTSISSINKLNNYD